MADVLLSGTVDGAGDLGATLAFVYAFAGTADGAGDVLGAPITVHLVSGALDGAGDLSGPLWRQIILGGQTHGAGTLQDEWEAEVSGTLLGTGTLAGTLYRVSLLLPLPLVGSGTLGDSLPLPMVGHGILSGYLDVTRISCPLQPAPVVKSFSWNYEFKPGDLTLNTREATGVPYSPIMVVYSLYRILPGGARVIVGPPNRRPAQRDVGSYYVTGTAGECCQPGCWMVQWRWQRFWYEQPRICEQYFRVLDAVLAAQVTGIYDGIPRVCKKGWL